MTTLDTKHLLATLSQLKSTSKSRPVRNPVAESIHTILRHNSSCNAIQRGLYLFEISKQIEALFPPQFKDQIKLANIRNQTAYFEVKSAVIRQSFLFQQQQILKLIQDKLPEIQQIHLFINPNLNCR